MTSPGTQVGDEAAGAAWAGAVEVVEPFEQRKLWLLNGSPPAGLRAAGRGHETVAEAVAWVNQWWEDAVADLTLPASEVTAYRSSLLER